MKLMLCTAAPGGMLSVVEGYRRDGLFERHDMRLLFTHSPGSVAHRVWVAGLALLRFLGLILSGKVELVHAHAAMRGSFWRKNLFLTVARAFGAKTVLHLHGSEFAEFVDSLPRSRRERLRTCLRKADRVLVLSESWRRLVEEIEPAAQVQVLPNYVLLPDAQEVTSGDPPKRVKALFLGLLGPRKGIYDLLAALAVWRARLAGPPPLELIAGGNGEVDAVRRRVDELGLGDCVQVPGWVGPQQKAQLLAVTDLYVLPSHNEGLPVSLLEAMSYGVPVISTRVGGIPELVRQGVDGLLVEPGDVEGLLEALITMTADESSRRTMGVAARDRVKTRYSRQSVLPQLEQVYTDLVPSRARH